jgi:hypothetical protein
VGGFRGALGRPVAACWRTLRARRGLAGSPWDWYASAEALRVCWTRPDLWRTGLSAAASGRLPSPAVEEVPSRAAAELWARFISIN